MALLANDKSAVALWTAALGLALVLLAVPEVGAQTPAYTKFEMAAPSVTEGRTWPAAEFTRQISGKTFLVPKPGGNDVFYFSPDKVVYTWGTEATSVDTASWNIELRRPPNAKASTLFACMTLPEHNNKTGLVTGSFVLRCIEPPIMFGPRTDHADGDVFGIRRTGPPPFPLPKTATTISALHR